MNNSNRKENHPLTDFYRWYTDKLYDNSVFRKKILSLQTLEHSTKNYNSALPENEFFKQILSSHIEEAELTLSLISDRHFTKKESLLEIGGGFGLVYGFLKKQGYDIWGIEPSDVGYGGYFDATLELFKTIDVDASHFQPFPAKEAEKLHHQFDIIFSNNVFEHVRELEESIVGLSNVLKPNGIMIHNNMNYFIPYDPHFKILLFPFSPRLTEIFKPSLKKSSLWNGLNFVTTHSLKKICKAHNLKIKFRKDSLLKTFMRLESDPEFAKRQKYFIPIYKILKWTGGIKFLNKLPSSFISPIYFTITKG